MSVLINGRTAVHKDSSGKVLTVDVCLTKVGKYTVPIPYLNMAQSQDSDKTAGGVFVDGNPACHQSSTFSKSRGDEPGNKKGIVSRKKGDYASFIMGSLNVQFEGTPAVRAMELMVSNARNTPPSPLLQAIGLPPLPKQAASEEALEPFEGPYFEPVIQEGRSDLHTRELVASLEDPHCQPEHEAFTCNEPGEIILSGLHRAVTSMALVAKEVTPREHKPNDRILIPLGKARHSRIGEDAEHEDIALVTLALKRYLSPDADEESLDNLREGWLYVYVDGHLWRELEVTDSGYRDVDLHTWHGTDGPDNQARPATGAVMDHLTVPNRLEDAPVEVQIAFSEVQWSWERISEFGGLKEDDPRLFHKVEEDETLTDIARYYPGATVEQLAELNDLEDPDQIQVDQLLKIRDLLTPPEDADERRQKRMGEPVDFDEAAKSDYEWVVSDPIGVADTLANALCGLLINQQNILSSLQGEHLIDSAENNPPNGPLLPMKEWYSELKKGVVSPTVPPLRKPDEHWRNHARHTTEMASLIYPSLFDQPHLETLSDDVRKSLEDAADKISQTDVETWLQVEERKAIRDAIRASRDALVQAFQEASPTTKGLRLAFEDYAIAPVNRYCQLWERFNELVDKIVIDPCNMDQQYDLPSKVKEEREADANPPSHEFLARLLNPQGDENMQHWHDMLFPTDAEVDLCSPDAPELPSPSDAPIQSAAFRIGDFAASLKEQERQFNQSQMTTATMANTSRGHTVINRALGVFYSYMEQGPPAQAKLMDIAPILRLVKGSGLPDFSQLMLVEAQQDLAGLHVLGEYRLERVQVNQVERLDRTERRNLTQEAPSQSSTQLRNKQGQVVGQSSLSSANDAAWQEVFKTNARLSPNETMVRARMTVLAVPVTSRLEQAARRAAPLSQGVVNSATFRAIPSGVAIFELMNFGTAMREIGEGDSGYEERLRGFGSAVIVSGAIVDAIAFWKGVEYMETRIQHHQNRALRSLGRTVKFGKYTFRLYRILGFAGNVAGSAFSMYDGYKAIQRNNHEAGYAHVLAGVLGLTGAALFFLGVLTGVAIALFIAAITAALVGSWLTHSPLESWAVNGPFSDEEAQRYSQSELADAETAWNVLQGLFFSPSITIKRETPPPWDTNGIWVSTNVLIPGFQAKNSVVEVVMEADLLRVESKGRLPEIRPERSLGVQEPHEVLPMNFENPGAVSQRFVYRLDIVESDQQANSWLRRTDTLRFDYHWRAKVRHHITESQTLPPESLGGHEPGWATPREWPLHTMNIASRNRQ
ncbi:MAG: DUF4150 domain-containing protein [Saccharospirillum sp.]|nr:DUF4150 domain-containing protein [Saccharospirillum sp.]